MRCYVIGDIHGCLDELVQLIEQIPLEPSDRLVFLGDYIDRGPDSMGVVAYLVQLRDRAGPECIFLKGNHEDMFLGYLGLKGSYGDMFLYNGGAATLSSYGISSPDASADKIMARMPAGHVEFFTHLQKYYLAYPFLCVHAGVQPLKPLAEQTFEELLWIRNEFIYNRHQLPYTVLFGHTPQNEVYLDLPYKIGLDTGLVYGNKLSCFELHEKMLFQIGRGARKVKRSSLRSRWNHAPHFLAP